MPDMNTPSSRVSSTRSRFKNFLSGPLSFGSKNSSPDTSAPASPTGVTLGAYRQPTSNKAAVDSRAARQAERPQIRANGNALMAQNPVFARQAAADKVAGMVAAAPKPNLVPAGAKASYSAMSPRPKSAALPQKAPVKAGPRSKAAVNRPVK